MAVSNDNPPALIEGQAAKEKKALPAVLDKPLEQTRLSLPEYERVATMLFASGAYPKAETKYSVLAKILHGQALGMSPCEAMTALHAVPGKPPSMSALAIAARIKSSLNYDYSVIECSKKGTRLAWWEKSKRTGKWECVGESEFNETDAKDANLSSKDNWKMYKRAMLFARALTEGARRYAPDLFFGNPIYSHEELGNDAEAEADLKGLAGIEDAEYEVASTGIPPGWLTPIKGSDLTSINERDYQTYVEYATARSLTIALTRESTRADLKTFYQTEERKANGTAS